MCTGTSVSRGNKITQRISHAKHILWRWTNINYWRKKIDTDVETLFFFFFPMTVGHHRNVTMMDNVYLQFWHQSVHISKISNKKNRHHSKSNTRKKLFQKVYNFNQKDLRYSNQILKYKNFNTSPSFLKILKFIF